MFDQLHPEPSCNPHTQLGMVSAMDSVEQSNEIVDLKLEEEQETEESNSESPMASYVNEDSNSDDNANSSSNLYLNCDDGGIVIDGVEDILGIDFNAMTNEDVRRLDFKDLQAAYLFYCRYARLNGFSIRKDKVLKSRKDGEIIQQTFVCSCQGYYVDSETFSTPDSKKRKARRYSRCGCEAKFRVHVDSRSGRWYVSLFNYEHRNHELLPNTFCSLLPAHRKLKPEDIMQIESFRKAGISPAVMFGAFANNARGYEKVGFRMKDIYNQMGRRRKRAATDSADAIKYLKGLKAHDPLMYVSHTRKENGELQHLFWSDGESQLNYQLFGDVLAFDATYKKNKYLCPFVIFSGVNHHNQTVVFATAIVGNETEQTYAWLLEQLMLAMKGKQPSSVITDGCLAMKNAIKTVFPSSHHRLCAWHLLRNCTSNVAIPEFLNYFKKCMLGDFDVCYFETLWKEGIHKFGLADNKWVKELYEKKHMWATSHVRGNFFAGIRTTSRCEALHSHMKKFVHSQISLTDFVYQWQRCLTYFRFREVEADFESHYGEEKLVSDFRDIEKSASKLYTREVFYLFREMLKKTSRLRVVSCQQLSTQSIYTVKKYRYAGTCRYVSYSPSDLQFSCSCMRFESFGLPCDHILLVLVTLDLNEVPKSLVLNRWSQSPKEAIRGNGVTTGSYYWDSHEVSRFATMHFLCRDVLELAFRDDDDAANFVEVLMRERDRLKEKLKSANGNPSQEGNRGNEAEEADADLDTILDPPIWRKIRGGTKANARRVIRCGNCGAAGHNRRSCNVGSQPMDLTDNDINDEEDADDADTGDDAEMEDGAEMGDDAYSTS